MTIDVIAGVVYGIIPVVVGCIIIFKRKTLADAFEGKCPSTLNKKARWFHANIGLPLLGLFFLAGGVMMLYRTIASFFA